MGRSSDPFSARPHIGPNVESRTDSNGCVQILRKTPPRGRLSALFEKTFKLKQEVRVNLDASGSVYWNSIDGVRDLAQIARIMAAQLGSAETECRNAVLLFTKQLMERGLIMLQLDEMPAAYMKEVQHGRE